MNYHLPNWRQTSLLYHLHSLLISVLPSVQDAKCTAKSRLNSDLPSQNAPWSSTCCPHELCGTHIGPVCRICKMKYGYARSISVECSQSDPQEEISHAKPYAKLTFLSSSSLYSGKWQCHGQGQQQHQSRFFWGKLALACQYQDLPAGYRPSCYHCPCWGKVLTSEQTMTSMLQLSLLEPAPVRTRSCRHHLGHDNRRCSIRRSARQMNGHVNRTL